VDYLDLAPSGRAAGTIRLPGSKSISNRTLLLAALAHGETELGHLLAADDVDRMREALETLGVHLAAGREGALRVTGCGGAFPVKEASLFLGNAGTAFRPLTAALALSGGRYRLSGTPRMHERPIGDLVESLRTIGATIEHSGKEGYPPLEIHPAQIREERTATIRGDVSSQFLTALLMALPLTSRRANVEVVGELVSKPYIEMTLKLMRLFGVTVDRDGWRTFHVPAGAGYVSPGSIAVEGDASSASYFLAAGAIGGGPVRVEGVGRNSIQGDVRFADTLEAMGAQIRWGDDWIEAHGGRALHGIEADFNEIPDAAMTAAVVALFARGPTLLRNIGSWRVKETDRIAAMARELAKLGASVEEGPDWLRVAPPERFVPATIDTYDDHRMAMCFSLAAIGGAPIRINDPGCVRKTFPGYFEEFAKLRR
jgi:3-phosphoshikimate 1-carboxyvinyltransferase